MSIEHDKSYDVAREAYESSLFEDMATEIVRLRAEVGDLHKELDRSLDVSLEIGRSLLRYKNEVVELYDLNRLDPKTGLLHYPAFEEEVKTRITPTKRAKDKHRMHSLLIADLDDFKIMNKVLGYQKTDTTCLLPVARILHGNLRPAEDVVGRFGGEEFVALLSDTDLLGGHAAAAKIREKINSILLPGGETDDGQEVPEFLGVSIGIAPLAQGGSYETAFHRANEALQDAKRVRGKNETVIWLKDGKS